jgi:hypothetical protein
MLTWIKKYLAGNNSANESKSDKPRELSTNENKDTRL